jgi:hypothetical protein
MEEKMKGGLHRRAVGHSRLDAKAIRADREITYLFAERKITHPSANLADGWVISHSPD